MVALCQRCNREFDYEEPEPVYSKVFRRWEQQIPTLCDDCQDDSDDNDL